MRKNLRLMALVLTAALSACGGGGGSSGTVSAEYQITLRAEKALLPLNVAGNPAGIGVYAPFTTTLYVQANVGGQPIADGKALFGCNLVQGLDSGALYYLDGDPTHQDATTKAPLAYRAVTLDSNSGAASFHFHASAKAGTARVTCSVVDPRDKQQKSASVDITVGGATGQAASISSIAAFPTLGTQGNLNNVRTSTAIEAHVLDDANQPVPAPAKANLQVAIASSGAAATGARLLAGAQSGSVVQVSTTGGVGLFSLSSGPNEGTILLQMTADRFDNDVTNGIQDPIVQLLAVSVTAGNPAAPAIVPLALVNATPPGGTNGLPYSYAFSATGGVAPYSWAALGGLPEGLSLSSAGILSGTPMVKQTGTFNIAVQVTDSRGVSITGNFALAIAASAPADPTTNVLSINLSGCGSDVNTACSLAIPNPTTPAPVPAPAYYYQYVLSVTGPGTGNAAWTMVQNPSWLALTGNGILSILWTDAVAAPALKDCTSGAFFITAARAGVTTMRKVQLVIGSGAGTCKP